MSEQGENVELMREQRLEAVVVLACTDCGAPGTYHDDPSIEKGWPGCYVESGDPLNHMPVGDICPNCGASRKPNVHKGTVWRKQWWAQIFSFRG